MAEQRGSSTDRGASALGRRDSAGRDERLWSAASAAAGGLAAGLGLMVILGWNIGSVRLTTLSPAFRPMVYTTALAFFTSGIGLLLLRSGRRHIIRALALVVAGVATVRFFEYVLGFDVRFELLITPDRALQDTWGGRVAPLTSLGFSLVGLILLGLTFPRRPRSASALLGIGASVVFAIGAVAVIGYLAGNPAYVWGPLTGMAAHTAAGLAILGAGLLLLLWSDQGGPAAGIPLWTPVLVFVAGVAATLSLWQAVTAEQKASLQSVLRLRASSFVEEVAREMRERLDAFRRMAHRFDVQPELPRAAWEEDARLYLVHYRGLRAVGKADADLVVRWVVPEQGGDAVSVPRWPDAREILSRAIEKGETGVTPPFRIPTGELGLTLYAPISRQGRFGGLVIAAFQVDALFDSLFLDEIAQGYGITVLRGSSPIYDRSGRTPSRSLPPAEVLFPLGSEPFTLRMWPSASLAASTSRMPAVVLVVGLLLSALLGLVTHFGRAARVQARALETEAGEREQAAQALAASEARFRTMSEALPLGVFLLDAAGETVYINEAYTRITGLSLEDAAGFGWLNGVHPEDRATVADKWREMIAGSLAQDGRGLLSGVTRFLQSGRVVIVEVKMSRILRGSEVAGWVGVLEDITERRRASKELAERSRLATFAAHVGAALTRGESLPAALRACAEAMVVDLGGSLASIWTVNDREGMLELQASAGAELERDASSARIRIGQHRLGRIAEEGRPKLVDLATDAAPGDSDWAVRLGMSWFAGYPLTVEGRVVGVMAIFAREKIGEATLHAMGYVADEIALGIDRARAGEAVRGSEARTRALLDNMLEGLIVVDSRSIIRRVNPAARRVFGYSDEELIGQPLTLLVPEKEGRDSAGYLREKHSESLGRVAEFEGRRKNGEVFPVEVALFEFWTSEGRLFGGSVRDISERREVDRLKREFVATVSHELRTPLTSIRGSLGLIAGGVAGPIPEQVRSLVEIAHKNSERLVRLVNDILDLEKIESGRIEFRMEPVEVGALAAAAAETNRPYAAEHGTSFLLEDAAPGARVLADRDRLTQVVTNLLSNAAKFSPSGVPVTLRVAREDGSVRLSVSDRGPGVPAEFRARIFQRFQQADSSDTRRKGGTGLGLSISKSIVDRLGGRIGFETGQGAGTTFFVDLPEWREAEEPSAPRGKEPEKPRVLHVDDDDDLRQVVERALRDVAQVVSARTLREARKRLAEWRYELVLLDIELPDGSGLELLSPGAELGSGSPPVLVFSAQDLPPEVSRRVAGALVKTRGSFAELAETVRSFLGITAGRGSA